MIFVLKKNRQKRKTGDEDTPNDLFFRDGVRRIDYIIAFNKGAADEDDEKARGKEERKNKKRAEFEKNLREEGLELEHEDAEVGSKVIGCFL